MDEPASKAMLLTRGVVSPFNSGVGDAIVEAASFDLDGDTGGSVANGATRAECGGALRLS